jgi:hypothetical protein
MKPSGAHGFYSRLPVGTNLDGAHNCISRSKLGEITCLARGDSRPSSSGSKEYHLRQQARLQPGRVVRLEQSNQVSSPTQASPPGALSVPLANAGKTCHPCLHQEQKPSSALALNPSRPSQESRRESNGSTIRAWFRMLSKLRMNCFSKSCTASPALFAPVVRGERRAVDQDFA